ncbi:hypothetical protein C8J56DRAFT_1128925 [Mycena floridula]|nr:hypothetical protein C8J56DRAFT_1128925 [Mycena floridula]
MDDDEPPQKRFKYQSCSHGLKEVHLPAARLEPEIDDSESHFKIRSNLVCESHPATFTWILLTALIHRVKDAEQISPISDVLLSDRLTRSGKMDSDGEKEELRRLSKIVAVSRFVRRGSRLTEKHTTTILTISITPSSHEVLLKFVTSSLVAAQMPLWLCSGRKLSWLF